MSGVRYGLTIFELDRVNLATLKPEVKKQSVLCSCCLGFEHGLCILNVFR